ncbi:MAG: sodium/proton antiporter, partial [Ferrimonas sp.]
MKSLLSAILLNFLGRAPVWYKKLIITFLLINPLAFLYDPFISGWLLVVQFIFILAMTLKCYPLQPGGLITIEAITIGMASPKMVIDKIE